MASIKSFLKKVNGLPVNFTIKHYYPFGETASLLKDQKLDSKDSWDYLRENHPSFSVADNREEWLRDVNGDSHKDGQDKGLTKRAQDVAQLLENKKIESIFSVGSGGGGLEYQIKKINPKIKITCSEYSQLNVDLLKKVFLEADSIVQFDIKNTAWPRSLQNKNEICIIYRIDASFTDKEWKVIFENMYRAGVENILFIPTNFLTILSLVKRFVKRGKWFISRKKFSFAGYLRTRKTFESYWSGIYKQEYGVYGGLGGFILKRVDK